MKYDWQHLAIRVGLVVAALLATACLLLLWWLLSLSPAPVYSDQMSTTPAKSKLKLLFVGDVMLDRHVRVLIGRQRGELDFLLSGLGDDFFSGYDLVSANLEGAVTDKGQHYPPAGTNDFAFTPESVAKLSQAGFNHFNLANNHSADQGRRGWQETAKHLATLPLSSSGCADGTASSSCAMTVKSLGDYQVALLGFSEVYRQPAKEELAAALAEAKRRADLVIVQMHWGQEYQSQFSQSQQERGRWLIDQGADLVIGHHPHVAQGVEIYQGRAIFYSLGNFIFDQYFSQATQQSLALQAEYDNGAWRFTVQPLASRYSRLSLMAGRERQQYLARLAGVSALDQQQRSNFLRGYLVLQGGAKLVEGAGKSF